MKRTGWAAIAATAVMLVLAGCSKPGKGESTPDTSPEAQRAAREPRRKPFTRPPLPLRGEPCAGEPAVWTLSDEDTTIRIMGTVHFLRPELDWRSEAIDTALAEADTLVFEADVSSPEAAGEMMRFVSTQAIFTDGRQLTSLLDEGETEELKAALDYLGFPLGAMQTFRPWYAAVNLSVLQMKKDGFDPTPVSSRCWNGKARRRARTLPISKPSRNSSAGSPTCRMRNRSIS